MHWGSEIIYYCPLKLKQDAQAQKTLSREGWVGVVPSSPCFLPPSISVLFLFWIYKWCSVLASIQLRKHDCRSYTCIQRVKSVFGHLPVSPFTLWLESRSHGLWIVSIQSLVYISLVLGSLNYAGITGLPNF